MTANETTPILLEVPEEIQGPRVMLRPRKPGDGAAVWEAVEESREQIGQWMPWVEKQRGPDDTEASARRAWSRWILREELAVGIWERPTGRFLGGSGLHRIDWTVPSFEIGYWLRTSAWGKGYVAETVRLLCGLAFDRLGGQRVEIRCNARNERSEAVARRLGFVQEGTLRNHCRDVAGELRATLVFAMKPEDYARAKVEWE